jgi:hypothetical protein
VLAYDYPLLGVFWTVVPFSLFFLWIFTVFFGRSSTTSVAETTAAGPRPAGSSSFCSCPSSGCSSISSPAPLTWMFFRGSRSTGESGPSEGLTGAPTRRRQERRANRT